MKTKDVKADVKQTPMPVSLFDEKEKKSYQTGVVLGTGGFARVFQITEEGSGSSLADKVIDKEMFKEKRNAKEKVEREIKIHRELNHKNLVKFLKFFEDRCFVHLLMELCPQKTLLHVSKYRKRILEEEARYYTNQITQGLNFLHSRHILHRDLKLGNMFLSEQMVVKIGDFGLASAFKGKSFGLYNMDTMVNITIPLQSMVRHYLDNFYFPRQQVWLYVRHPQLHRSRSPEEGGSQSRL